MIKIFGIEEVQTESGNFSLLFLSLEYPNDTPNLPELCTFRSSTLPGELTIENSTTHF